MAGLNHNDDGSDGCELAPQPRYLQEVLEALLAGQHESVFIVLALGW